MLCPGLSGAEQFRTECVLRQFLIGRSGFRLQRNPEQSGRSRGSIRLWREQFTRSIPDTGAGKLSRNGAVKKISN